MSPEILLAALQLVAFFMLSFFFSGSETAFFSLQPMDRREIADIPTPAAGRVITLLKQRSNLIITVLIGNESANIAITTAVTVLLASLTPPPPPWVVVLVVPPALILMSEITPKVLGFRFNRTWALRTSGLFFALHTLLSPLRKLVDLLIFTLAKLFGVAHNPQSESLDEADFLKLVERGHAQGVVNEEERDIIEAVFELDDLSVSRVMTPRPDMFSLDVHTPWHDLLLACREAGFSRVPIWEDSADNIIGVLLVKDLLRFRKHPPQDASALRGILLAPLFIPASKPANELMKVMIRRRVHIAFVIDEHGSTVGLVSLDDLIMELVGELNDESSEEHNDIESEGEHTWRIRASIDLDDLDDELGLQLPHGEYHTLAGWILDELGRIPIEGDVLTHGHGLFEILAMEGRRIGEVRLTLDPAHAVDLAERTP